MPAGEAIHQLGLDFVRRVQSALTMVFPVQRIFSVYDKDIGLLESVRGPDIFAELADGRVLLVEVRNYSIGTSYRIEEIVADLNRSEREYCARYPDAGRVEQILAISGVLSSTQYQKVVDAGVTLIDGPALAALETARATSDFKVETPIGPPHRNPVSSVDKTADGLLDHLRDTIPGQAHWARYQRLCGDIFQHAFCPPLQAPISELANHSGVNRRDIIFPNYADDGFWRFVRDKYRADHVVVDAKNYSTPLKKTSVLQIANYLNEWGCGLFGILCTRKGAGRSASETIREQWIMQRKLILVLDDGDITQLLELKRTNNVAEDLMRQKIEDFRLSF